MPSARCSRRSADCCGGSGCQAPASSSRRWPDGGPACPAHLQRDGRRHEGARAERGQRLRLVEPLRDADARAPTSTPNATGGPNSRTRLLRDALAPRHQRPDAHQHDQRDHDRAGHLIEVRRPDRDLVPWTASETSGKIVPQKIAKTIPRNSRLLSRKLASRDSIESSWLSERRRGSRQKNSASEPTIDQRQERQEVRPDRRLRERVDRVRMPLRTTNVPKMPGRTRPSSAPCSRP